MEGTMKCAGFLLLLLLESQVHVKWVHIPHSICKIPIHQVSFHLQQGKPVTVKAYILTVKDVKTIVEKNKNSAALAKEVWFDGVENLSHNIRRSRRRVGSVPPESCGSASVPQCSALQRDGQPMTRNSFPTSHRGSSRTALFIWMSYTDWASGSLAGMDAVRREEGLRRKLLYLPSLHLTHGCQTFRFPFNCLLPFVYQIIRPWEEIEMCKIGLVKFRKCSHKEKMRQRQAVQFVRSMHFGVHCGKLF